MKKIVFSVIVCLSLLSQIKAQDIWEALDSPGGANVNTLFKVTDSIYLIGVQFDGSLYRTTNAGLNWEKVFQGHHDPIIGNRAVRCFIFNSVNEILVSTYDSAILRSTDQGKTWIGVNGAGGEGMVNTRSGIMFGYDNVFSNWSFTKSIDSGRTWTHLPFPPVGSIYSMINFGDTLFVGYYNSIIYSSDFANSWTQFGNSFPVGLIYSILFLNQNEVFAGGENGIFYSSNSGTSWVQRNNDIPGSSKYIRNLQFISDTIFAIGKMGLIFTIDKGENWQHYNSLSFQKDIYAASYSDNLKLICNYAGVYKVIPDNWIYSSQGIYAFTPYKLLRGSNGDLLFNTSIGLFKSTNDGIDWNCVELDAFLGGCRDIAVKNDLYFVLSRSGNFYISSDNGSNWNYTGNKPYGVFNMDFSKLGNKIYASFSYYPPNMPPTDGLYVSSNFGASWSIIEWNNTPLLLVLQGDTMLTKQYYWENWANLGLQKSDNQGLSWYNFNEGLSNLDIRTISIDNNNNFYTSNNNGVFKRQKDNNFWERFSDNTLNSVNSIAFDVFNNCIVVNNGKILGSVNGKHWDDCSSGISANTITKIISDPLGIYFAFDRTGRIYVSNSLIIQKPDKPELFSPFDGVNLISDTVGFSWFSTYPLVLKYNLQLAEDSLFITPIDTIISDTTSTLYNLGADKKYFWRVKAYNELGWGEFSTIRTFSTSLTATDNDNSLVTDYSLSQNYPNPFNPSTKISWQSPVASWQTLKVYDILGKEVATLVNEYKPAGSYEVEFNSVETLHATSLPSGVYFYQIKAGNYIETKKMILMR